MKVLDIPISILKVARQFTGDDPLRRQLTGIHIEQTDAETIYRATCGRIALLLKCHTPPADNPGCFKATVSNDFLDAVLRVPDIGTARIMFDDDSIATVIGDCRISTNNIHKHVKFPENFDNAVAVPEGGRFWGEGLILNADLVDTMLGAIRYIEEIRPPNCPLQIFRRDEDQCTVIECNMKGRIHATIAIMSMRGL